ncbi:MAG: hypothetical protein ACE3JK_16630 [Sporolactobacillus sp.]
MTKLFSLLLNLRGLIIDALAKMLDVGAVSGFFGTVTEHVEQIRVLYF